VQPIAYVLAFIAVMLAIEGAFLVLGHGRRSDPDRVRQRLRKLAPRVTGAEEAAESLVRAGPTGGLSERLRRLIPGEAAIELTLYRAGMPTTLPKLVLLTALSAGLGFAAVAAFTSGGLGVTDARTFGGSVARSAPGLLAGLVPWLLVRRAARQRMRRFEEQLPEGLDLLTRALRAGHGLSSGFQLVGDELDDPIGTEFGLVAEEVRFGLDLRDALDNMVRRVDNQDLPFFTTAVLIQRQTGGNLAELLDKLGVMLRQRAQFFGRVRALTAQGRGAATFLALWLPAISLVVHLVAPTYLVPLFENAWGHAVIATAVVVDVSAYVIARRIADVQA
jgi:tight adherence protein B